MQKNMKIKDEHGQILVSRALDPRKIISWKILKMSGDFQPNKTQFLGELSKQFGFTGVSNSQSIAEIRWIPIQMAGPHVVGHEF